MNITRTSLLSASSLLIGGLLGASSLIAFASWTPAPANPPSSNTDAPINVGSLFQNKVGKFGLGSLINYSNETNRPLLDVNGTGMFTNLGVTGNLLVSAGASTTYGAVLTTTGNGIAKWAVVATTTTTTTTSSSSSNGYSSMRVFNTSGTWTAPTGVIKVKVRLVGGGGGASGTGNNACNWLQHGGGSGGYAEAIVTVNPGSTYQLVVGAAGTNGAAGGTPSPGSAGGATSFSTTVVKATGGLGGTATSGSCGSGPSDGIGSDGIGTNGTVLIEGNSPLAKYGMGALIGSANASYAKSGLIVLEY